MYADAIGAIALLLILGIPAYFMWFMGRVHEAGVEYREEQLQADAYSWAARHGKLPEPQVTIRYVDLETGVVLEEQDV